VRAAADNVAGTVRALRGADTRQHEVHPAHVVGALYDVTSGLVTISDDAGLLKS